MPLPYEYQRATDEFERFLHYTREVADLGSTHQAYTLTQGVLQAFRRRVSLQDGIRFAAALPTGLRALFVESWDPEEPRRAFEGRDVMTQEVQALRPFHNFASDTAIRDVATALRWTLGDAVLDQLLAGFSAEAVEFWRV